MMMGGDVECSAQIGTSTRKNHSTEYSTLPIQIPSHFTDIQMKSPQLLLKDSIRYLYATPRPRTPLHASDRSGPLYAIQSLFKDPVQTNLKHTQIRNHHHPCNETMKRVPSSRSHEYLEALKDERRKIQVFHRELPLCLELVDQAIESCRQQLCCSGRSDCEEQTQASGEGPVLEEFMPLKRSSSSECEEESNKCDEKLGKKVDWLRSVQLWNHSTDLPLLKEDSPRKNSVIEAKKNGGAFHPFRKEKSATTTPATTATTTTTITTAIPTRITVPVAAASSTADNGNKSREDKGQSNKKSRRCWSPELHRRFLQALQQLGGSHAATPKQIREFMNVDGLTNDEVKSHLQKYRLHTRRPAPHLQNNSNNSQSPQFLVVGGIWVPPPEYAPSEGEAPQQCTKGIYGPVAAPPPQLTLSSCTQQQKQISESDGHNNSCSGSPTPTSSSMDTTTASPAF